MTSSASAAVAGKAAADQPGAHEWHEGVAASEAAPEETASANPRKRKKSSRACDYCHVNHQPCDNAKPRCSYCEKHDKQCLYLRPQKKRGPAQGYRNALHSMRESAAAWGAALTLVPELASLVEAAVARTDEGKRLAAAVRDPQQQDSLIQSWQQSVAFRAFFGDDAAASTVGAGESEGESRREPVRGVHVAPIAADAASGGRPRRPSTSLTGQPLSSTGSRAEQSSILTPSPSNDGSKAALGSVNPERSHPSVSVSDLVVKDAARSSDGFSQTLGSLGFAPGETVEDFVAMASNPEPMEDTALELDPSLGSEMDQKAYYELLMGKSFFS
ncbi:hypothetical protein GGTG_03053 [Gaeumannomyces tritici R3-111a-1]|uniref:Zn(2)-C6 fungal-type domain-containing protein n=1 Tax=Gaeumannomyces tritici (strain R3-111a-1) TaxID=644352 RepID=J3NP47_GAET3|nr:hypothetical protein GGTG_03053 [Gaeumannomyces tritici R3-111a-1]EJT77950.1 hypothetical protein GGTG_03053 [Gaeumannomyces tritici R3-111a-1]